MPSDWQSHAFAPLPNCPVIAQRAPVSAALIVLAPAGEVKRSPFSPCYRLPHNFWYDRDGVWQGAAHRMQPHVNGGAPPPVMIQLPTWSPTSSQVICSAASTAHKQYYLFTLLAMAMRTQAPACCSGRCHASPLGLPPDTSKQADHLRVGRRGTLSAVLGLAVLLPRSANAAVVACPREAWHGIMACDAPPNKHPSPPRHATAGILAA